MQREPSPLDVAIDLCRDGRRRALVATLADRDRRVTLQDLAKDLAVQERDAPITEVSGDLVTELYALLYHVHLPKLAAANVVDYDRERGRVELTGGDTELEAALATIVDLDRSA